MIGRNSLFGPVDPAADAGYDDHPKRKGFFTDTSVCIGCKACEVACKQWNELPGNEPGFGDGFDNTGTLDAQNWRHVEFIDRVPDATMTAGQGKAWLMMSDVCKHCVHAPCLEVCPTGAIMRTEFDTVYIQEPACNGCRDCIAACPLTRFIRASGPMYLLPVAFTQLDERVLRWLSL